MPLLPNATPARPDRPVKQASYYAETVAHIVPLTAELPWYAEWFAEWTERYAYLAPS